MTDLLDGQIRNLLAASNSIAVVSHIRPDGDAVGSVLGLGLALKNAGKDVQMVLTNGLNTTFQHLQGYDQITHAIQGKPDLLIVVDCSDLQRTGSLIGDRPVQINIDHHITNLKFADVNLVEPTAVATCAILAERLPAWGLALDKTIAEALMTGILTDTIGFRTSNMSPHALRIAASLMELGVDMPLLYNQVIVMRSFEASHYWGFALSRLQRQDRLVWTSLTLEDRQKSGYNGEDDADLTNILSGISDIDIAVLFVEQRKNRVKVSWRAAPGLDVSSLAAQFGGGGHAPAAGADIAGTLEDIQKEVLKATQDLLNLYNDKHK